MPEDLTEPDAPGRQIINSYFPGGFRVSGERLTGSVLVFPERTLGWSVSHIDHLDVAALTPLIAAEPAIELVLLGCGKRGILLPSPIREALRAAGIGIEAMDTGAACRTTNLLMAEGRRVAGALIALSE